jgi:hypothetical protein
MKIHVKKKIIKNIIRFVVPTCMMKYTPNNGKITVANKGVEMQMITTVAMTSNRQ